MPERIVTKGIVLRVTDTKEADQILTVLTPQGKLGVIARGARRRGSRIAASCQLLAFSELVLYERGGWSYLDEASTLALFDGVRQDVALLSLASYFAEMAETVTAEEPDAGGVLPLLLNALYALDTLHKPPEQVRAAYELALLARTGYEPLLDGCAVCGKEQPDEPLLDAQQGVLLCRACAGAPGAGLVPLCGGSLAAMRHILHSDPKRMLAFRLEGESLARLSRACETFAAAQLDRGFRTLDFYKSFLTAQTPPER